MTVAPKSNTLFDTSEWRYFVDKVPSTRWVIICDSNTAVHCLSLFCENYLGGEDPLVLKVSAGEKHKTMDEAQRIWTTLMDAGVDRHAILVCLGGGMITDLGAFAGNLYKRGLRTVLVPTTLLAMTDAAIGGKNGVNFRALKNQLGTIREPEAVLIDPVFLNTLPLRELRSGFAETIKHALIGDARLWSDILNAHADDLMRNPEVIRRSIHIKKRIVAEDPQDMGLRQVLNFGHTVGHALESVSHQGRSPLLHGECVAFGMKVALELSVLLCEFPTREAHQIQHFLDTLFPDVSPTVSEEQLLEAMKHDKKNHKDQIVFSLLRAVGDPLVGVAVEKEAISASLKAVLSSSQ